MKYWPVSKLIGHMHPLAVVAVHDWVRGGMPTDVVPTSLLRAANNVVPVQMRNVGVNKGGSGAPQLVLVGMPDDFEWQSLERVSVLQDDENTVSIIISALH